MTPFAPPPQAPPKKSGRGCIIALSIVGGLVLLGLLAAAGLFYAFATSDVGKTTFKVIGEGTKIAEKGMKAPGAAEVRALGCEQAMVIDMKDFAVLFQAFMDAGDDAGLPDELMVTCQVGGFKTPPACDEVAATYVRAVGVATSNFVVSVQRQGSSTAVCQEEYDPSGVSLGSFGGAGSGTKRPRRRR